MSYWPAEKLEAFRQRTEERRKEPHWLYRMYDEEGTLLYVGQTHGPEHRMAGWRSRSTNPHWRWVRDVRRIDWLRFPNWESARAAEKAAIAQDHPVHNTQHKVKTFAGGVA